MLVFIDNAGSLRVYRAKDSTPGAPRSLIGRIHKNNFEYVNDKDAEPASEEEQGEIQRVIGVCRGAQQDRLRLEAVQFPEVARRVAEFYATSNNDVEKRLIATAAHQMMKAIRKVDQASEPTPR